ncbi:MAG: hypothetical protein II951_11365 [Bacteroidales bacterium]|nr:hypothetical protein [Bacteroidales bacterium]
MNKKVWSADADVSVGNTAVVKSPDGDVILRIMALPGDTVSISDASVGVSDSRHAVASFLVMRGTPYATLRHLSEEHKAVEGSPVSGDVYRLHVLTRSERWRDVTYTHPLRSEPDERVFPWSSAPAWNFYHWGPFVLPRRGQSIVLSPDLFPVYAPLIRLKEAADPVPSESYTFKHSYYFALSDDRDVINDCRLFGPLTESEIIGRARVISN